MFKLFCVKKNSSTACKLDFLTEVLKIFFLGDGRFFFYIQLLKSTLLGWNTLIYWDKTIFLVNKQTKDLIRCHRFKFSNP